MNQANLIEDNINLVYSLVSKLYPTYLHDEDIIQSGMVGLCKAAAQWDSTKSKFSTYAWKCIQNEIRQEFVRRKPHSKEISLDTSVGEDGTLADIIAGDSDVAYLDDSTFYYQLTSDERNVLTLSSMGFTPNEIAELSDLSVSKVRTLLRVIKLKWRTHNGE